MTVAELIKHLQGLPNQDARIQHTDEVGPSDIERIVWHKHSNEYVINDWCCDDDENPNYDIAVDVNEPFPAA